MSFLHRNSGLRLLGLLCFGASLSVMGHANSETLEGALVSTYKYSPDLKAARARLEIVDEGIPQARAGFLPQVTLDAGVRRRNTDTQLGASGGGTLSSTGGPRYVEIKLIQPIFDGLKAYNEVAKAEALVLAEQEALRNSEQTVMYATVEAFMRVVALQQIVDVRRKELAFLKSEASFVSERSRSGQVSKADFAQARARVAAAETGLNAALAQLNAWSARYTQNVGKPPANLKVEKKRLGVVPGNYDSAVEEALQQHPAILAAQHNVEASKHVVSITKGDFLPTLSLEGSVGRSWDQGNAEQVDDAWLGLRLSVPLYRGGATTSKFREANARLDEAEMQLLSAQDQIATNVQIVWGDYLAARSSIASAAAHVKAQRQALDGIKAEERVGQRSPIDVLNAQSELVSAQINLIEATTQSTIASYGILASIGKLDSVSLGLMVD